MVGSKRPRHTLVDRSFGFNRIAGTEIARSVERPTQRAGGSDYRVSTGQTQIPFHWLIITRALNSLEKNEDKPGDLKLSSNWFSRFALPTKLIEIPPPAISSSISDQSLYIPPAIFKADIPIVLLNPVTTPVSSLLKWDLLLNNTNAIILLTAIPSSPSLSKHILSLTHSERRSPRQQGTTIIFVNPEMALRATETLREDPKAPRNVEEYRTKYMDSHVGDVNTAISNIFRNAGSLSRLREQTALSLIRMALEECRHVIKNAENDLDSVCDWVSDLRSQVENAKAVARGEVLGHRGTGTDEIYKAMKNAEREMKEIMDELNWWVMLGRVDEIGMIVGNGIRKVWCRVLENKVHNSLLIASHHR